MSMLNSLWFFWSCLLVGVIFCPYIAAVEEDGLLLMPLPLRIQRAHSSPDVASPPSLSSASSTSSLRELHLHKTVSIDPPEQSPRSLRSTARLIRKSPVITDKDRGRYAIASASTMQRTTAHDNIELTRWEKSLFQYKQEQYEAAAKNMNRLSFATLPLYYNRALIYMQWYLKTGGGKLLHYALMDTDRAIEAMRHFYPAYVAKARIAFFMRRYRVAYDVLRNLHDLLLLQVADRTCILYDTREYVGIIYLADVLLNMGLLAFRFGSDRTSNEHFEQAMQILRSDIQRDQSSQHLLYIYDDRMDQYCFVKRNKLLIPDLIGMWMEPIYTLQQTDLIPTQFTTAREAFSVRSIMQKYTGDQQYLESRWDRSKRSGVSPLRQVTTANDMIMARQTLPSEVIVAPQRPNDSENRAPLHQFSIETPNDTENNNNKLKKHSLRRLWKKITCS